MLKDELKQHYLDTTYIVNIGGKKYDINIGHAIPIAIQELLNTQYVKSAAIITAWNPKSQTLSALDNSRRNQSLLDSLKEKKYSISNALGQGKDTAWKAEESYLVLGISKKEVESYAIEYEQNAYVWIEHGRHASLIYIKSC